MRVPRQLRSNCTGADLSWLAVFLGARDFDAKRMNNVAQNEQSEIGRVRSLYMDFSSSGPYPRHGDRMNSGKTLYYVLFAREVKRRSPDACVRIQMRVMRAQDMADGLEERLLRSAVREHFESLVFSFSWYSRKKKRLSFEQYMRGQAS